MASKDNANSSSLAAAYEAGRAERQANQKAHVETLAAVEQAKATHAAVVERNAKGDASVSALDLLTAEAEVKRCEGLAAAAADAVKAARAAERPFAAEYWSNEIAQRVAGVSLRHEEAAVEALADALRAFVGQVEHRNDLMLEAVKDAKAAGIKPNKFSELRFGYQQGFMERQPSAVYIDGSRVPMVEPENAVLDVLTRAVAVLGYRLTALYGSAVVVQN